MITAVPVSAGQISPHFSRADTIVLLTETGQVIEHFPNPVTSGQCMSKDALSVMLQSKHVSRVLVRNIGQCMLEKLLLQSFDVYQVPRGFVLTQGALDDLSRFVKLECAQQGKVSPHGAKKAL